MLACRGVVTSGGIWGQARGGGVSCKFHILDARARICTRCWSFSTLCLLAGHHLAMSESVKSWLFSHCASQAIEALEGGFDLADLPYVRGNRVQLLRFLTFRTSQASTDIWALVGDRTHCIAARFSRTQVDRFQHDRPISFTALKGALVTMTNVKITVARVQMHTTGGPYRPGQYAMVLDVKGFKVVSSMGEPVWFGGVKLVTSPNAVPEGEKERAERMVQWMKKWIRYKCLLRRARADQRRKNQHASSGKEHGSSLPTPAQRAVMQCSQVHNVTPVLTASLGKDSQTTNGTPDALWGDYDLDADVAEVDVPNTWTEATSQQQAAAKQTPQTQQTQQTHTQSGSDPDESGLSDYERQRRRRKRKARPNSAAATPAAAAVKTEEPASTDARALSATPSTTARRKRKRPSAIAAL